MKRILQGLRHIVSFTGVNPLIFILISLVASFALGGIEFLIAIFLQLFIKNLGLTNLEIKIRDYVVPDMGLNYILLGLFLIVVIRFLCQLVAGHCNSFASEKINCRIRSMLIYDFLYRVTDTYVGVADIFFKFQEVLPKAVGTLMVFTQILGVLVQLLFILGVMFFTLPNESMLGLVGIGLIGAAVVFVSKLLKPVSLAVTQESKVFAIRVQRAAKNILFFDVMRTKEFEFFGLSNSLASVSGFVIRASFLNNFITSITPLFGIILISAIVYLGKNVWHSSSLALLSFLYLLTRFIQNLSVLSGHFASFQIYSVQFKTALNYFLSFPAKYRAQAEEFSEKLSFYGSKHHLEIFHPKQLHASQKDLRAANIHAPSIRIESLTHRFPVRDANTFENISVEVASGQQLGILGRSGAGKSTLLHVIMGILEPNKGQVLIDQLSPKEYFAIDHNRIGYVGAEPYLIKGSLRENLLYGIKHFVTDEEIQNALEFAKLSSLVSDVGLNYQIEEDHSGLSAGQKQRLCLARAILNKPGLLVLDEATANLDEETERSIAESLLELKGKCTILIVSHRAPVLKHVDQKIILTESKKALND